MPSFFARLDIKRARQAEHTAQRLRERFGLLGTPEQVERLTEAAKDHGWPIPDYKQGSVFKSHTGSFPNTRWVLVTYGKHVVVCCLDDETAMVCTVVQPRPGLLDEIKQGA